MNLKEKTLSPVSNDKDFLKPLLLLFPEALMSQLQISIAYFGKFPHKKVRYILDASLFCSNEIKDRKLRPLRPENSAV